LPPLFIAIAAFALVLGLIALWQSLRVMLLAQPSADDGSTSPDTRIMLVNEKTTLLKAIKELEQERASGKISDQDYEAFNARYRARARDVLQELDSQLGDYREQAQALVDKELKGLATPERPNEVATAKKATDDNAAQPARIPCPACQADNEIDAAFCKKCGKPIAASTEASESESEPTSTTGGAA